jgi:hypothetical protein
MMEMEMERRGTKWTVVVKVEEGGGLWKALEKRREIGMQVDRIGEEVVGAINDLREDGDLLALESCSKRFRRGGRSDLEIEVELTQSSRKLARGKIERLFDYGIKKFIRSTVNPNDYLRA